MTRRRQALQGAAGFLPLALVIFSYGVVFGILALRSGLTLTETCLMSLTVFAGASQFIALPMIRDGAPAWTLVLMALVVNLRHLLYGLHLGQVFRKTGPSWRLALSFGIIDESYAFATLGAGRKRLTPAYFLGAGLSAYAAWNLGTLGGAVTAGTGLLLLGTEGLDFATTAVFLSLVGMSLERAGDWILFLAAGALSLVFRLYLGGYWHLILAGTTVPLAAAALARLGRRAA